MRLGVTAAGPLLCAAALAAPAAAPEPVAVGIVGTFHMASPGRDRHNLAADDLLAPAAGLESVAGIDVDGEFPYDAVAADAKEHEQSAILEAAGAEVRRYVDDTGRQLASGSVGSVLRLLNDPARLAGDNAPYRTMLHIGGSDVQPGAELLTARYRCNLVICARLIQRTRPGDRVAVSYGSGHAFLLRQCVTETPGLKLVEAIDYLPPS